MNEKNIYINANEEITSVIDKLIRTKEEELFLVIPEGAVISQSLVNLKLLKREADNLRKKVTIVSQDSAVQRLAKKTGFSVSESLPEQLDEHLERPEDAILQEQVTPDEFKKFLKEEKKSSSLRMSDIIKSGAPPPGKLTTKKIEDISEKSADLLLEHREETESKILGKQQIFEKEESIPIKENFEIKSYKQEDIAKKPLVYPAENQEKSREAISTVSSFPKKIFGIFIISAIIIAGVIFYLVLPKADVSITAKREQIPFDFKVLADKNLSQIDAASNKIPAQLVKLEERDSQEFLATGRRQLNEKAKGTITVYNAYSSSPQALVETTRFLSQDGKIFRLTKTIRIPGAKIEEGKILASFLDVDVEADQPGAAYNIGPSNFSIPGFQDSPKYAGFYGKSKGSMSGGSTENVKVVTQDDFDNAKSKISESLNQKIQTDLAAQISSDLKVLEGATETKITEIKPSVDVGGKAEKFMLSITSLATVLVFKEADVYSLLQGSLSDNLDGNKEMVNQISFNYKDMKIDIDKGQMSFGVAGSQEIIWKVNQEEIKKLIAGKQQSEVRQILSGRQEIKEAQFSLWPFWAKSIPKQIDKINIIIDSVK